jgi:hypothetical protein
MAAVGSADARPLPSTTSAAPTAIATLTIAAIADLWEFAKPDCTKVFHIQ